MKINPLEVKHLGCDWQLVLGNFGPHQGKLVCKQHQAFLRWAPKYLCDQDIDPSAEVFIKTQKHLLGNHLFEQGDLLSKIKYQDYNGPEPMPMANKLIKYLSRKG